MKGDFTRSTFDKRSHYSSVRWQQGRVHVDADWNEAMDILAHRGRTTRRDVIGLCGGPAGADVDGNPLAGFLIDVDAADGELHISPGRYYVDGVLVENDADVALLQQPDLPANTLADVLVPPGDELSSGTYLAFLDVWERHITALEDPAIREVALGGPDTATRTKVVWQVKLMAAGEDEAEIDCASDLALWQTVTAASTGRLAAQAEPLEGETAPCIVPAQAGYRGLENQLYRVEVHRVISEDEITIKWSRENGSVASAWLGQDTVNPNRLTVQSTGRDKVLGFAADDWVELTDDIRELRGQPGLLVQIQAIEGNVLIIKPGGSPVDIGDFPVNPKVRRWDMPSEVGEISVDLTLADNWIELENGVQVKFDAGIFHTGDYWLIPARTATRGIEWPKDDATPSQPLTLLPHGIHHHYCRLALLSFDGEGWSRLSDCRHLFPSLTEMVRFFHVGGDGCCVTVGKGGAFKRLDEAISTLLEQGERDICLCLLAGEHVTTNPSITLGLEDRDLHIAIHGCGMASRLTLNKPWLFKGVRSVTLRDMVIEPAFNVNNVGGAISFQHCSQVTVTGCTIRGCTPKGPLMSIADANQVRLRDNLLEASRSDSLETSQKLFNLAEVGILADLFSLPAPGEFREKATAAAKELAGASPAQRKQIRGQIQKALGNQALRRTMSGSEFRSMGKLLSTLAAKKVDPVNMLDLLLDIRRAAIKARPGLAVVLGETFPPQELPQVELGILDGDDLVSLESNEIAGVVSLYGLPASQNFLRKALTPEFLKTLQGQLAERRIVLNGLLGTLNIRGNQLVQITVAEQVLQALQDASSSDAAVQLPGLFGRCLLSDNVFEGGGNLIVDQHLTMNANDFKMAAAVQPSPVNVAAAPSALNAGIVIADTSIYTGNHAGRGNVVMRDISRASAKAANLEINIA